LLIEEEEEEEKLYLALSSYSHTEKRENHKTSGENMEIVSVFVGVGNLNSQNIHLVLFSLTFDQ
jgi:hypothetical protein